MNKIDCAHYVHNEQRRFGQAAGYHPCVVIDPYGIRRVALFTPDQLYDAMARARNNEEDIPPAYRHGRLRAFAHWLASVFFPKD